MHQLNFLIPMGSAACGQDTYQLPETGQIELAIYNISGQQVAQLVCDIRPAGRHAVRWDGRNDQGQHWPAAYISIACAQAIACKFASYCC